MRPHGVRNLAHMDEWIAIHINSNKQIFDEKMFVANQIIDNSISYSVLRIRDPGSGSGSNFSADTGSRGYVFGEIF
jgi:hypothetical protein